MGAETIRTLGNEGMPVRFQEFDLDVVGLRPAPGPHRGGGEALSGGLAGWTGAWA